MAKNELIADHRRMLSIDLQPSARCIHGRLAWVSIRPAVPSLTQDSSEFGQMFVELTRIEFQKLVVCDMGRFRNVF